MTKISVCCIPYLRKHTSCDFHGQKIVQNDKNLSVVLHIAGTIHRMIVIYVANVSMIISPGVFFNVKIMIFQVVKGLKQGQKMTQNVENVCLSFRNHISYD